MTDVTERKRVEDALRKSEEKYRQIVETSHDGVWLIDAESRTTFVNNRMAEMLGYTPEEMLGQTVFEFVDEEVAVEAAQDLKRRHAGVAEEHDVRLRRKDLSDVWTIMSAKPLPSADEPYLGALATVTDITERKRAEAATLDAE